MVNFFLHFAIVVGGASVLGLEILGTRVIGPHVGVSLYLWSALISVTLAALAAGYAVGGRWADKGPTLGRFSLLFGLAGLWVVLTPWLQSPAIAAGDAFGLRGGVLFTATVLFFPPLFVLGMVSPYAIRLKATRLEEVGRTAGNLYALSTLASVGAALLTGFVLIPRLGVTRLLLVIGILLMVTALLGALMARRRRDVAATAVLLVAAVAGLALTNSNAADPARGLLVVRQSPYAEIRVVEKDGLRFMLIDGASHTIVDPETWRSDFPYVDVLEIVKELHPTPGRLLLVGLGGGSVAKSYAADGWQVDAVEIDAVVSELAASHFGLQPAEATVHHGDGRRFLADQPAGTYDLVIMDAFGSSSIPFHLVTREVFALVRSRLARGGLVAMNVEALGWHDELVHAVGATLNVVFANVQVLPMAEPPDQLGNVILLAADWPLELMVEPEPAPDRWSRRYHLIHAWDNRFAPRADGRVLTDDLNPVDLWSNRINVAARAHLHEFFGPAGGDR